MGFNPVPATNPALGMDQAASSSLIENITPIVQPKMIVTRTVTGYSSTPEETDDTPFITASGSDVRHGVVAANWLPFGTKVKIPELFGDQVFVVEDRMHNRHTDKLDVWFPAKAEAIRFGSQRARIEVL